jgi:hypothetical protein
MRHGEKNTFYAMSGQFTTLDGKPYSGPYYILETGIPMSGESHHYSETAPLLPVKQSTIQYTTGSMDKVPATNTTLNENTTVYDLIPTIINQPPIVTQTIAEGSIPPIRQSNTADGSGNFMYQFPDGTVRVHKNTSITLRVQAQQPDVLNVENGILVIKPHDAELTYTWTFDGEVIGGTSQPVPGFLRVVNQNELILSSIQPQGAGTYNCIVTNDIGSVDAGTITIEVYNSNIDGFFFENLIQNGDATDDINGWSSMNEGLIVNSFAATNGERQKSITTHTLPEFFEWTQEMLYPRPYNLNFGDLRIPETSIGVAGIANQLILTKYFTRDSYKYTVKDGIPVIKAYQDIDLSGEFESYIKGGVYGVDGVRGVFTCYVGNAIFQYELNNEAVTPGDRLSPVSYYLGAPRLSVENFSKAGPGFVQEKVYITLEEFQNNQPLQSRVLKEINGQQTSVKENINVIDPWSSRLPKYSGQVYYTGGRGFANPDLPSLGDSRDAHLFVADEILPNYEDRYTYGQYAEFRKEVIDRLDPRTNKVRITINIEAPNLGVYLRERGGDNDPLPDNGLWEVLPWTSTWPSRSFGPKNNDGYPYPSSSWDIIQNLNGTTIEKMPRIGLNSRALVTGLTFALVPVFKDDILYTNRLVNSMLAETRFIAETVDSPIDVNAAPYNAATEISIVTVKARLADIQSNLERLDREIVNLQGYIKINEDLRSKQQAVINKSNASKDSGVTQEEIKNANQLIEYYNGLIDVYESGIKEREDEQRKFRIEYNSIPI